MTYAFHDLDRDTGFLAEPSADRVQVFVVAGDASLARRIAEPMQADDTVETRIVTGALPQLVLSGGLPWDSCDFLVCHMGEDEAGMLAAIHCLLALPGARMQCVAMVDGPVDAALEARMQAAGVSTVLSVPGRDASVQDQPAVTEPAAEEPAPAAMTAGMPRRLHLTDPVVRGKAMPAAEAPAEVPPATQPVATTAGLAEMPDLPLPKVLPRSTSTRAVASLAPAATALPAQDGTGRITTVLRARGGAGASTVAVNLALTLAGSGGRVALIDLDIQNGSVGVLLDIKDSAPMTQLMRDGALPDDAFLSAAMVTHESGLAVLPAPDTFVPLTAFTSDMVAALMDLLQARYDHVIVDMPQSMLDWIEPVFERASQAVIVTDTSVPSIKRSRRLMDVLGEEHMTLTVQVVVNKEKRPLLLSESQKEAARLLGRRLDHWIPEDARAARRALDAGVPLAKGAPRSRPARAITALSQTLFPQRRAAKPEAN